MHICAVKASSPSPSGLQVVSIWRPLEAEFRDEIKEISKCRREDRHYLIYVCGWEF